MGTCLTKRLFAASSSEYSYNLNGGLLTDLDLDSYPVEIDCHLYGQPCRLFIKPNPNKRLKPDLLGKMPMALRHTPEIDHAIRTGKIIRGRVPHPAHNLVVLAVWCEMGDVYEANSTHDDYDENWHDLFYERLRDAASKDSFVTTDHNRRYFFRDVADAAWFKLKWA